MYLTGKYVWHHFAHGEHENQTKCRGTFNKMSYYTEAVVRSCSTEVYLEISRTSTGIFAKIVNGF